MKYIILIFFLIAFVNLKQPKFNLKSLLAKPQNIFFNEEVGDDEDSDENRCESAGNDTDVCKNVKLINSKNFQCCLVKSTKSSWTEEECQLSPYPAKDIAKLINTEQFGPMTKELIGFFVYGPINDDDDEETPEEKIEDLKTKTEVSCKDAEINMTIGYDEYTEDDKTILKSNDYCLYYLYDTFKSGFINSHNCKNGKVLKSSQEAEIECGRLEVEAKIKGQSLKFKSCFLYSYDFYKQVTLPNGLKKIIEEQTSGQIVELEKFKITFSDSNGNNKVSFDLSSSYFLMISKYLSLLILFLF